MYMTPERFRTFGTGVDLDDVSDVELRSHLHTARSLVDNFCNVPMLPNAHSFKGGVITSEEHSWRLGDGRGVDGGSYRFWPYHFPVKSVTSFRIYVTSGQYVDIPTSQLIINNSEGWVEPISLALSQFGIFGYGLAPFIGLANPVAKMSYTYGYTFSATDEVLEPTDAMEFRAQNQFWTPDSAAIKVNGTTAPAYVANLTEGTVVFASALAATDEVTASYTYGLPPSIAQATALIAGNQISEQDLTALGMNRLEALAVEEVTLRRTVPQRASAQKSAIPPLAAALLEPFVFRTVRG